MANMNYAPPEGFSLDPQSGRYYRQDGIVNGQQWVTWFDAESGQYEQMSYPVQPAPQPEPTRRGGNRSPAVTVIIILALILGSIYAGHYFGLYTIPFLTNSVNEEADRTDAAESETESETRDEGNPTETSQPPETATPTPALAETPALSDDEPQQGEALTETPQTPVTLNTDLMALIGQTNRQLLEANGKDDCTIYYWGGSLVADYVESEVPYPVSFFLFSDNYEEVNDILEYIREVENSRGEYPGNIWPESYRIDGIEVQQGPYDFNTNLQDLFISDVPLTFENISASFERDGVLNYWPLEEQVYDGYGFDVWQCTFLRDDYRISCTFYKPNDELMLYRAMAWREN